MPHEGHPVPRFAEMIPRRRDRFAIHVPAWGPCGAPTARAIPHGRATGDPAHGAHGVVPQRPARPLGSVDPGPAGSPAKRRLSRDQGGRRVALEDAPGDAPSQPERAPSPRGAITSSMGDPRSNVASTDGSCRSVRSATQPQGSSSRPLGYPRRVGTRRHRRGVVGSARGA